MGGKGSGRKPSPCGTPAKYRYHRARGQDCPVCRAAWNDYIRARYKPKRPGLTGRARSRNEALEARLVVIEAKLARGGCADCGRPITLENYMAFDLDHVDPADKSFTISTKYKHVGHDRLRAEIAKCELLCAYCHRLRTHRDRHHLLQIAKERRGLAAQHPTLFEEPTR